ncbi:MAG TPA: glycosyltransferase family 2 protein [Candidatus Sulfopaludibacter sp.]|nr:glycosyltransferase family 2 protein [Candidatus Sulfopaludibacter sp.]
MTDIIPAVATAPPVVSIIILNFKRREALARCLASARAQTYPHREIVVVDNASGDGIGEYLAREWPEARLVALAENRGASGGRNAGIAAAAGDLLITVDNDVYFEGPEELSRLVQTFAQCPEAQVLACQLCDEATGEVRVREWCHARSWEEHRYTPFETHYFIEGASAYRREVFDRCGGYYEPLFLCAEGDELGLRILDAGFRIRFTPEVRLRHLLAAETRGRGRCIFYQTRNYVWIAYKDFHFRHGLAYAVRNLTIMAYFALRNRQLGDFARGIGRGLSGLKRVHADRSPIGAATVAHMRELERWRPSLWARLRRHRREIQL